KNFDLMGIYHASSSFAKTSKGDILFTREREFRQADTLVSYSKSNQFLWKRPIKAKSIDAYASRLGTIAHNLLGETAYIDDSSKLILLDSLGHLKRSIDIEKEGSKIMNLESQREWVVFFDDTHAKLKLQKFDWHGNLTLKSDIDVPRNWSIYSCIDLGNQGLVIVGTSLVSIDAKGQKRWEIPFSVGSEIYKPFSNGAILGYDTQKTGPEKATLISSNGKILLSTNISNVAESPDGGALIATSDSLYSINPKGEIAWGIKHSSSYAIASNDKDGGVLLTESINMDTVAVRDYIYDSVFELGLNVSHQLSKFSKEGKLIWKTVLNFPPLDKYLFRTLSGAYAAEKDTYNVLYLFSDSQERLINNNLKHFHGQRNYLLKITRPCYERVSATLRSTSTALCPNQHLQLQANADSLGLLSYQWQRDGQTIANTTKPSLNINAGGTYRVVVRDSICGSSATSTEVRVVARPTPQASVSHTGNLEFCQNSDAPVLNTAISNTDWRYQWLRNGQPLLGIFQNSLKAETSGNYQISVRDSVCNTVSLSNTIVVRAKSLPEASISVENTGAVYAPFKVKLRANEGAGLSYQWAKENINITNATASTYEAAESGSYTVQVTQEGCSRSSASVGITILQPLSVQPLETHSVIISPNPNQGTFTVSLPLLWQNAAIELIDLSGKQVSFNRQGLDFQVNAPTGVYWLLLKKKETQTTKKIVLVR
nr:T9SS type A sorting domain-containing protein [Spirosomataceae bacterium]